MLYGRLLPRWWRPDRQAAGALMLDPAGRLLMVRDRLRREWSYPGGYVNVGESARAACAREIREEVGIAVLPERLELLDAHRWQRPLGTLNFTTFAVRVTATEAVAVRLQRLELTEYRWVATKEAARLAAPRLRPRLSALLARLS